MPIIERRFNAIVYIGAVFIALFFGLFAIFIGGFSKDYVVAGMAVTSILLVGLFSVVVMFSLLGRTWAMFLYVIILGFLIEFSLRAPSRSADIQFDIQSYMRVALWGGALLIGAFYTFRYRFFKGLDFPAKAMTGLVLLSMLSVVYSIVPVYTLGAALGLLGYFLFSLAAVRVLGFIDVISGLAIGTGLLLVISLLIYLIKPELVMTPLAVPGEYRFRGLTGSPNSMGWIASLFFIFIYLLYTKEKVSLGYLFLASTLALVSLYLSSSRVAAIAAIIAAFAATYNVSNRRIITITGASVFVVILVVFTGYNIDINFLNVITRSGDIREIFTLSNRSDIWIYSWGAFLDSPWFGYGFASTRSLIPSEYATQWGYTVTSAHNMFLQSLLMFGGIGTLIVATILLTQLKRFFSERNIYRDILVIYILLLGLTEASAVGITPNILTFVWMISIFGVRELKFEAEERTVALNAKC